ncbi:tripartite motif-containing protein 2-like [Mytilus edulis]|uniref:tripartite motif-containing protein 2-like n=1 Tax=Mytilus edulis TaxID=6550 RepID=UPI0039EE176F
MAAKYCEPCTARGMTPTASQWCTECEEALCSDCTEAHRVQKMSRNHHLVQMDNIPKQIHVSYNCPKHQQLPFDYFCVDHDVICCKECWPKNHQTCKNVTSIDIASKNSKQSQSFLDSEEQLRFILETLEKLSKNCKDNESRINADDEKILKQIKTIKENVIKQLKALEETLLKQLAEKKDKYVTSLKRQDRSIKDLSNSTKAQKESLEFFRDHGSEKQAFVSIRSSKPILDEIENKVKQLIESFANISLTFVESGSKEKLTDLGTIEIKETPCSFPFSPYKQRQSQVPVVLKRQITSFTHFYDVDTKGEKLRGVTGMTVSDNNTLVFCDVNTSKVYFCDDNDTYQSSIISPYKPWDISTIPGTTTAVMSSKYEPYIQFIDISNRRLLYKIEVKGSKNSGIAATKDHISISTNAEMQVLDVSGKFKSNICLEGKILALSYICVCSNGNICFSSQDTVYCITSDGDSVFTYASTDLCSARSIQVAGDGHIYVVGRLSNNIHKLTSTGTLVDILLNDYISNPLAFCFNHDFSKIYMANKNGEVISVFTTDR